MTLPADQPSLHPYTRLALARIPSWMTALDKPALDTLGNSLLSEQYQQGGTLAAWFTGASNTEQAALLSSQETRAAARQALAAALGDFQGLMAFAEPLLRERLKRLCGVEVDVHGTLLVQVIEQSSWKGFRIARAAREQSLLMAALHNFNQDHSFDGNSGLVARDGYWLESVPPVERAPARPQHHGDLNQDLNDLVPVEDDHLLFHFKPGARLALSPDAFARECRDLDIGQRYQAYLTQRLLKATVRKALLAARSADLECLRQVALLKGDIDANTFAMLGQVLTGQPLVRAGQPMQAVQIEMLHAVLNEVIVFMPQAPGDAAQPCVVWMPGDSQAPLRQYSDTKAFVTELAGRLRKPGYFDEFQGRVSLADRPDFHTRLTAQLARHRVAFGVLPQVIKGSLLEHLHDRHLAWLHSQSAAMAIPTAQVDATASVDRWERELESGINLLNYAALFIPGLGAVMLPVIAAQAMGELYHGVADLADHQFESGWEHLGGLALNIVLGAVVHQSVKLYADVNPFVDDMLPVELPDGEQRLWNPDVTPYATDLAVDPTWQPDAQGLYEHQGERYLVLDGKLYLTRVDARSGERVICRPDAPDAYQPTLTSDGRGAWLHEGETPLSWPRARLLRRVSPAAAALTDAQLEQALSISGCDEAVVRQALVEHLPVPLELTDTLTRLAGAQQVDTLIANVRSGQAIADGWPMPIEQVVSHPRWPSSLVLQVFEGSEPWGESTEYGNVADPAARWVSVVRADLASGGQMGQLLDGLGESACDELLGSAVLPERSARIHGLQTLLADQMQQQRPALFQRLARAETVSVAPGSEALPRDFPGLDGAQVRELVEGATTQELERLKAGRVPLRMAEEARVLLRERRLNRAIAGVYQPALANPDSTLVRAALGEAAAQKPIDRVQAASALNIQRTQRTGFNSPVRVGARIGYPASGRGRLTTFDVKLIEKVNELYPTLETSEVFELLTETGLPEAQLRGWLKARRSELKKVARVLDHWVANGKSRYGKHSPEALNRVNVGREINRALRRTTPRTLDHDGQRVGYELNLTDMRLDDLPALEADFSHVKGLTLQSSGLTGSGPDAFLRQFKRLRHLRMARNELIAIPEAVAEMPELTRLRLSHNRIVWGDASARVLNRMPGLRELDLSFNPLGQAPDMAHLVELRGTLLPGTGLRDYPTSVLRLPLMSMLDLRHNSLETLPADVLAPPADQAANIVRINANTHLQGNPLTADTLQSVREYQAREGTQFNLPDLLEHVPHAEQNEGAPRWLQAVAPALQEGRQSKWETLYAEPGSHAFFDVLGQLSESSDFQNAVTYPDLRERVWHMIEAAIEHTELRETLFEEAIHGATCGDGAALLFSQMQVRTLAYEASWGLKGEAQQAPLLTLAKGLFRLDEVEKAAAADIAGREGPVDKAEVQLAYRTRLADPLDLPGQPKGMRFERTAAVSPKALNDTLTAIQAMEGNAAMVDAIASRDFWTKNLREIKANEARFASHDTSFANQLAALDTDAQGGAYNSAAYLKNLDKLKQRRAVAEKRLVVELTQEVLDREVEVTEL